MTYIAKNSKEYQRRQIVARMGQAGEFSVGRRRFIIWRYMTFYCGRGEPAIAAEFVRKAKQDKDGFLRMEDMREGELLVTPGLVYRKIPMSGIIMAEHLRRMKTFKPKDEIVYAASDEGAVDLGVVDLRTKH